MALGLRRSMPSRRWIVVSDEPRANAGGGAGGGAGGTAAAAVDNEDEDEDEEAAARAAAAAAATKRRQERVNALRAAQAAVHGLQRRLSAAWKREDRRPEAHHTLSRSSRLALAAFERKFKEKSSSSSSASSDGQEYSYGSDASKWLECVPRLRLTGGVGATTAGARHQFFLGPLAGAGAPPGESSSASSSTTSSLAAGPSSFLSSFSSALSSAISPLAGGNDGSGSPGASASSTANDKSKKGGKGLHSPFRIGDVLQVNGDILDKSIVLLSGSRKFKHAMGAYIAVLNKTVS